MSHDDSPSRPHRRVLIVEDEPRLSEMLRRAVTQMEFAAECARSGEQALRLLEHQPFDIMVLDLNLPGMGGMELFEQTTQRLPLLQTIILTGYGELDAAKRAIHLNVVDFLTKPCRLDELEDALNRALRRRLTRVSGDRSPLAEPGESPDADLADASVPGRTLQEIERDYILATLARHGGNRESTAAELGISVRTLYYRLSEYQKRGSWSPTR